MAVIATGFFDGVHLGHRRVIDTLVSSARQKGEEAIVITFDKHPRAVLQQDARSLKLLSTSEEKVELLRNLGVDKVEVLDFNKQFANMTAKDYLKQVLIQRYSCSSLILGYDNRLGSDTKEPQAISDIAATLGLQVSFVSASQCSCLDEPISSTKIREALTAGNLSLANQMLGYEYKMKGVVVPGKQYGRTIGFPTANMQLYDPLKLYPAKGVYLTKVHTLGRSFYGMTNVGDIIETNIFDFNEDIYCLDIQIQFKKRLRDMRRFSSGEQLQAQLISDRESCLALCADLPRL